MKSSAAPPAAELLAALLWGLPNEAIETIDLVERQGEWAQFERLAAEHRVLPSLSNRARALCVESRLPGPVAERLEAAYRGNLRRNLLQLETLARVLRALRSASIPVIVLKGAGLAETVYENPGHRFFMDLDLLVHKELFDRADGVLRDLGFAPAETRVPLEFYFTHHFHVVYHDARHAQVELHWGVVEPSSIFRLEAPPLFDRARRATIAGEPALVTAPEDTILHLTLQGVRGGFCDLTRVQDVALLTMGRAGALAWSALAARAREGSFAGAARCFLEICSRFFALPDDALRRLPSTGAVARRALAALGSRRAVLVRACAQRGVLRSLLVILVADTKADRKRLARRLVRPDPSWWAEKHPECSPSPGPALRARVAAVGLARLALASAWLARLALGPEPAWSAP